MAVFDSFYAWCSIVCGCTRMHTHAYAHTHIQMNVNEMVNTAAMNIGVHVSF